VPGILAWLAVLRVVEALRPPVVAAVNLVSSSGSEVVKIFRRPFVNPHTTHEVIAQPCAATIAESVCVVCWRTVGDTFGRSCVDVTECVRHTLEIVGAESHLVGEDEVVS
jgi:hypothetical protein